MGLAVLLAGIGLGPATAQLELSRSTIDGGGIVRSTSADGVFEMSGTIGQPDAGLLSGGAWELSGGFWFPLAQTDCDEDGGVNLLDFGLFETCAEGPVEKAPTPECRCFDVDGSATIDLADFAELQNQFGGT